MAANFGLNQQLKKQFSLTVRGNKVAVFPNKVQNYY